MATHTIYPKIEIGQRFERLVVIEEAAPLIKNGRRAEHRWLCQCDCGNTVIVIQGSLRNGTTKSCGCLRRERMGSLTRTHGRSRIGDGTYKSWRSMLDRCYNENNPDYDIYGGRGITVFSEWHEFEKFADALGPRPPKHTIERIDNDKGYEPGNVRWATRREQANNRSNNVFIEWKGEKITLAQAADIAGISVPALRMRLKIGWSIKEALTIPLRPKGRF
jgi:hypothetical protein